MEIIAFEEEAFYKMVAQVVARIKAEHGVKEDKWISGAELCRSFALQALRPCRSFEILEPSVLASLKRR
jgi:hypothetical protein